MNPSAPPSSRCCPACGSDEVTAHGKRYAVYPAGCLMLFAFPFAMIHQISTPFDYECRTCGKAFTKRTLLAKFCLLLIFALILWFIVSAVRVAIFDLAET